MGRYTVSCFNGGPLLGLRIPFLKLEAVEVEVDADSEAGAITIARGRVSRDHYEVVGIR